LDEALLHAVIAVESGYNATVVSKKGAIGLMQLMPDTASRYKVHNSFDPVQNIQAGAQYLRKLLTQFDNNVPLALAAYNAGEKNVIKYGRHIPPYAETIAYVPKVMNQYRQNSLHGP
jgi:soluble lytic murein transglycosylase-like protein